MKSVIAILLLSIGLPAQTTQTKAPTTDAQRIEALKLSQMCADAGAKYMSRFSPTGVNTQTHYNRVSGRCLLLTETSVDKDGINTVTKLINDAVEGLELAAYVEATANGSTTLKWCYTTDSAARRVLCVNDLSTARLTFEKFRVDVMNH